MDAFTLNAAVGISRKHTGEDWLKHIHNSVVNNSIRIIWQSEYYPFFWLMNREGQILRGFIFFINQKVMKLKYVTISIQVVPFDIWLFRFPFLGYPISQIQVIKLTNPII